MYKAKKNTALLQAHRGVSTDFPENTMSAYIGAIRQGYDIIELDPSYTADGHIILFHDWLLGRTVRNADGSLIEGTKYIQKLTLDEARSLDAGSWFSEEFKGEKIPTFEEVLKLCKEHNMPIKIDNKIQHFSGYEIDEMFRLIKEYDAFDITEFTCTDLNLIDYIVKIAPTSSFHYDGYADEWHLRELKKILKDNSLTVWLRYDNPTSAWCKIPAASEETAALVKKYAKLGIWILSENEEADIAADKFGADYIETTGSIKPNA